MEDDMFKLCVDCGKYPIDDDHECELPDTNNDDESNLISSPIETTLTEVQNIEELIKEVFKRTPLWDSTLPYEKRGPSKTKLLWSQIDKRLNLRPGTANVKWRNLRDTYVRKLSEQKKYIPSGSAAEAKPKVSWPYFELLGFLRPTVMRRKTFSNINPPASCSTNSNKRYMEQQLEELNSNTSLTTCRSNSNKNCTSSGNRYITSSPNLSDTGASESSLQENVDYCNQHKFRVVTSDYSPMQQNVNSMVKIEETETSKNIPNSSCKNTTIKNFKMSGKKRRMNTNKKNDELSLFQQSIMSEITATDKSINDTFDPVIAFCNYLTTQLRTLSQDDFTKCQRKILSFVFELQDN